MKINRSKTVLVLVAGLLVAAAIVSTSLGQATKPAAQADPEKAVLARLAEIQQAAQDLDPDKVFSMVLENDQGALVQNGRFFLTRKAALDSTRQGFQGLQKVAYQFNQQHVTLLSPTIALVVGEGASSATTTDGRTLAAPFAQSVVLVLTNGAWQVFHAHRSTRPAK
jgi:hypothetical protein